MSRLRSRAPALIALGTSALAGATYRYLTPPSTDRPTLNPHTFTPYTLISKTRVSSTSAIFTLRCAADTPTPTPDPDTQPAPWTRGVWSVQVKQPQLQIARAYTPLPDISRGGSSASDGLDTTTSTSTSTSTSTPTPTSMPPTEHTAAPSTLRLLIRHEKGGEVSTYLHGLPPGATMELRGPNVEAEVPRDVREVVFLAGGTGIAPAMQVARVLGGRTGSRMRVFWASRRREECVGGVSDGEGKKVEGEDELVGLEKGGVVRELEALKEESRARAGELSVRYYVDEERRVIEPGEVVRALQKEGSGVEGSKMIFVSGPSGFIEYWAGRKLWVDGREVQGPLGGVLGKVDLGGWRVVKL